MPTAVSLALAALAVATLTDFLYKLAHRGGGIDTPTFMIFHASSVSVVMGLAAMAGPGFEVTPMVAYGGPLFGAMGFFSRMLFVSSLRDGEALVNPAIYRLSFVLTSALAVGFLAEPMTGAKTAGIAAAVAAIGLFGVPSEGAVRPLPDGAARLFRPESHLVMVLAAMTFAGVLQFFYKIAVGPTALDPVGAQPQTLLTVQGVVAAAFAYLYALSFGGPVLSRRVLTFGPLCGGLTGLAVFLVMSAFRVGEASVVAPIAHLSFPLTGLMGVAFLGERLTLRKLAGLAAAVISVLALAGA